MKTFIRIMVVVVLALSFGACASKNQARLSEFAITEMKEICPKHPKMMQDEGIEAVLVFKGIMNPALLAEVIERHGVFRVVGTNGVKQFLGYAYYSGQITSWGDLVLQFEIPYKKEDESGLKCAKFIVLNRDGGYAFSVMGEEIVVVDEKTNEVRRPYDNKKFGTNENERFKFIQEYGLTLAGVDDVWRKLFATDDVDFSNESVAYYYTIGSDEWADMVDSVNRKIVSGEIQKYERKRDGTTRIGHMAYEKFIDKASDVSDFKGTGRFIQRYGLPLIVGGSFFLSGGNPGVVYGTGLLGTVYSANIDNAWHQFTLNSEQLGIQYAPLFVDIVQQYKSMLAELKKKQKDEIQRLKSKTFYVSATRWEEKL